MSDSELLDEYYQFVDKVTTIIKENPKFKFLHQAASMGYSDLVAFLLQHGFNARSPFSESDKSLPIHFTRNPETIKVLLRICPDTLESPDNLGRTILHIAVLEKKWDLVKFLLENGADPNQYIVGTRKTAWILQNNKCVQSYIKKYMQDRYRERSRVYLERQTDNESLDSCESDKSDDVLDYLRSPSFDDEFKFMIDSATT